MIHELNEVLCRRSLAPRGSFRRLGTSGEATVARCVHLLQRRRNTSLRQGAIALAGIGSEDCEKIRQLDQVKAKVSARV